jgi:3-oxoacyl-(acyl-carrier-protein) synthase
MSLRIATAGAGATPPLGGARAALADARAGVRAGLAAGRAVPPRTSIESLDPRELPAGKSLRRASNHVLFGIAAAAEALREAGGEIPPEECGLVVASALGSVNFSYRLWKDLIASGPLGASPVLFSEGVPNALAGHVAHALKLLGPGHMLGAAADSGLRAVALARDLLEQGRARRVLVAASEERSELATRAYRRLGVVAKEPPHGSRRGATRGRELVMSEGAGALVLDAFPGAAPPPGALGELLAVESVQTPGHDQDEDRAHLVAAFERALAAAGAVPSELSWLGSASNGTSVDRLESGLLDVLARRAILPPVSRAVRAAMGDALAATPLLQMIEALATARAGRAGVAAVLSIGQFGAATIVVFRPALDRA